MNLNARRRWLAATVVILALAAVGAQTAFARIMSNTIDPVATLAAGGRHITLTGPIGIGDGTVFMAGETAFLRVVVTQRSTGAVAEGIAFIAATGAIQQWKVKAVVLSRERFEEGPATAVALARTTERGHATDSHQWLVDVTLVR